MRKFYRLGRVLLAPSLIEEGFGRIILEAQFNGIPAIASNVGGYPEAVGGGGFLCDPTDIDDWCNKLELLSSNPKVWNEKSISALKNSDSEKFDADMTIKHYENEFENLISNYSYR